MALVVKDRVRETSTTSGTGAITLAGAVSGFQSFSVIGDGNTTYYAIVDPQTGDWEVGIGIYTASGTTLSRDTVLESSNSGNLVNFVTNPKDVFVTYPAERAIYTDAAGTAITPATASVLGVASGGTGQSSYTDGQLLIGNSTGNTLAKATLTAGTGISVTNGNGSITVAATNNGDVVGPASATDNAVARFDGTTGKLIQNSVVTIADSTGDMSGVGTLSATTVDTTNIEVTNVKAKDGTASATIADTTGYWSFSGTGAFVTPKGNDTTQRPGTPESGMLRFNTTINEFEGYNGTAWASVGGSAISNDTTTATDLYPTFVDATTGTALEIFTSNAQYLFKPSTGELKVKAPVAANGILVNATTMTANYTIDTGTNGLSVGPFTIDSGVTLTIETGQRHLIL
jgi:hypothetical protein